MFFEHIKMWWNCHIAAGAATLTSLINGQDLVQSVAVGVTVFVITYFLRLGLDWMLRR